MTPQERAYTVRESWSAECERDMGGINPFSPEGLRRLDRIVAAVIHSTEIEALEWAIEQIRTIYDMGKESHVVQAIHNEIVRRKKVL